MSLVFAGASFALENPELKGGNLFTRTNLRAKGKTVFFHNMATLKNVIPVGTAVVITKTGSKIISFKVINTGMVYRITDRPAVYKKYFVENKDEIGLNKMKVEVKEAVRNMVVYPGMTKDEVFVSKGCPAYIAYGVKSWGASLEQVMASDAWYYNLNTRKRDIIITFKDGIVSDIKER